MKRRAKRSAKPALRRRPAAKSERPAVAPRSKRAKKVSRPKAATTPSAPVSRLAAPRPSASLHRLALAVSLVLGTWIGWSAWQRAKADPPVAGGVFTLRADGMVLRPGGETLFNADENVSVGGNVKRRIGGDYYRVDRHSLGTLAALSPGGVFALKSLRLEDIPMQKAPTRQGSIQSVKAAFWDARYRQPVWERDFELELLTEPVLTAAGEAWFVALSPNLEPAGNLKLMKLSRAGELVRAFSLARLRQAGLDTADLHRARLSPDGRTLAADLSRSQDVASPKPMKTYTFFFDLEKGRMWSDKRLWQAERMAPEAWDKVAAELDARGLDLPVTELP